MLFSYLVGLAHQTKKNTQKKKTETYDRITLWEFHSYGTWMKLAQILRWNNPQQSIHSNGFNTYVQLPKDNIEVNQPRLSGWVPGWAVLGPVSCLMFCELWQNWTGYITLTFNWVNQDISLVVSSHIGTTAGYFDILTASLLRSYSNITNHRLFARLLIICHRLS